MKTTVKLDNYKDEIKEVETNVVRFDVNGNEISITQDKDGSLRIMGDAKLILNPNATNVIVINQEDY